MTNTLTLVFTRVNKLKNEEREDLWKKLGSLFMQPIDDREESCWKIEVKPNNVQAAITYAMTCYTPFSELFPLVTMTIVLSESPASQKQLEAARSQLLSEWEQMAAVLTERIEGGKEQVLALMEDLGQRGVILVLYGKYRT